ncbi:MAG: hypothetical protein M9933_10505 [Chitinophagaceae bacterium]|nr:hypothetical protein [Chitinophagaceae bacterium]
MRACGNVDHLKMGLQPVPHEGRPQMACPEPSERREGTALSLSKGRSRHGGVAPP